MQEMETSTFSKTCDINRSMDSAFKTIALTYDAFTKYLYGGDSEAMEKDAKEFGDNYANVARLFVQDTMATIQRGLHSSVLTHMMHRHLVSVFGDRLGGAFYVRFEYKIKKEKYWHEESEEVLTIKLADEDFVMPSEIRLIVSKRITAVSEEEFASSKEWAELYRKIRSYIRDLVSKITEQVPSIQLAN